MMTVGAAGTGLYAKAKQRMLNKIGKKTSLTRSERVDYVSPRMDEISRCRKDVTSLINEFRNHYRNTLWAGTQLGIHLVATWSAEIGQRSYVPEIDAYIREKNQEEMLVVQEASDDIRTAMESLEKLSTKFDNYLKQEATGPFGENLDQERIMRSDVQKAKEVYKSARTRYSDAMINFKLGATTAQDLDSIKIEYETCTQDFEMKMARYEENWRNNLFDGISDFFKIQIGYIERVSESLSDVEVWTSHLSLDVVEMKRQSQKDREERETAKDLQGKAGDRVRKPRARPIFGDKLSEESDRLEEQIERFVSGSNNEESSDDMENRRTSDENETRETSNGYNGEPGCNSLSSEEEGSQDGSNTHSLPSKQQRKLVPT